jgi:hypothetical protein
MSADRTVSVGEYGHSKIRCDGSVNGHRCTAEVVGRFRKGVADARRIADERGWETKRRVKWGTNGSDLRDYCPAHRS